MKLSLIVDCKMSEDATIEDDVEAEQQSITSKPQTSTGLLPWSYIFEIGKSRLFIIVWLLSFV